MRHARTIGALVLALALGTTPYAASGEVEQKPGVRTIDPGALRRGPDAAVDHLQDGVIRTASGRRITVGVPYTRGHQALLGRRGNGWLVASKSGDTARVHLVRKGRRPVEVPKTRLTYYSDAFTGWRLSQDGRWLLTTGYDRGGSATSIRDLVSGKRVASTYSGAFFQPLDAADGHVVTYAEDDQGELSAVDWAPPAEPRRVADDVDWADLRRNLVFVRSGNGYGPTDLDAPGTPPWSARFQPLDVSPDGSLAIGLRVHRSFDDPAVLELRRMADGELLQSFAYGPKITMDNWSITAEHEQTARFETDRRFVFQLTTRRGAVLVRCRLSGRCQRASDWGGDISTPHERFMW